MSKRREPERSVRVVYLVVNRETGKAVRAALTRSDARHERRYLDISLSYRAGKWGREYDSRRHRVERQELVRSSRKNGGA